MLLMLNNTINLIWREKKHKTGKMIKNITQQPKTSENPNIVDIKSITIEHSKTSCRLSKTIWQA